MLSTLTGREGEGSITRLACEKDVWYHPQNAVWGGRGFGAQGATGQGSRQGCVRE